MKMTDIDRRTKLMKVIREQIVDIIGKAFKQINSNASDVNSKIELPKE